MPKFIRLLNLNQILLASFDYARRHAIEFIEDTEGLAKALATKEVLFDTHGRIGMILDLLPVGLLIHQPQGILFANQAACEFLADTQEALVGQHFLDHLNQDQAAELSHLLNRAFESNSVFKKDEVTLKNAQGEKRIISVTIAKLPWEGVPVVQLLLDDITMQVERERKMQIMVATDTLTGAQNRRSLINYVNKLKKDETLGDSAVLLWDIDFFKKVNDTYGHQAGDTALKSLVLECEYTLAQRILVERPNQPRPMLARFGGEEFAIIIPNTTADEAHKYAERIRSAVAAHTVRAAKSSFSLTVSIGITMGNLTQDKIDHLLNMADKALYRAKENGRNQIVFADSTMATPPKKQRISRKTTRLSTEQP